MNKYLAAVIAVLIGVAVVAGTAEVLNVLENYQTPQTAAAASASGLPSGIKQHVNLHLDTFPQSPYSLPAWMSEHHYHMSGNVNIPSVNGPHLDWVVYGPTTNLVVPAYSEVTITINQYDSGGSLLNGFYSNVRGTIGNKMTVDGKTMSSIPYDQVAHTFTIHGIASDQQPWLFVNVPLLKNSDNAVSAGTDNGLVPNPHVITFSFYVYGPGKYVWQCEYPCGSGYNGFGGPMSTNGFMNGTFTVV